MNVREFEDAVWERDTIRIVIRAPSNEQVEAYNYVNAANATQTLTAFINGRIRDRVGDLEVIAVNGSGTIVNGNTHLNTVRATY